MRYSEARRLIKSGDILAFTHRKFSSWYDLKVMAVRFFTASKHCHVGIAWVMGGRVWLLEAVQPKVRIVPLSLYAEEGFDVLPMGTPMSKAELETALSQVGKAGYSEWQAVLAFFRRLKIGKDSLTQCCEYAIVCRSKSGVDLGPVATPPAVVDKALSLGARMFSVKGE